MNPVIRLVKEEILSDNWYVLKKVAFERKLENGAWEMQTREAYDRGNGAAVLLYNRDRQTVILTRQFRLPTYLNGNSSGLLIEACAGLLDQESPEESIRREAEEETGYRVAELLKVGEVYMSPGSVTELLHLFVAAYTPEMRFGRGGGLDEEQEHIEVLELSAAEAFRMVRSGEIRDAKTIMLLQHLQLEGLLKPVKAEQILVAGPYRSGTGDDPRRIEQNMEAMRAAALRIYEAGHMPVLGEWIALPLIDQAGGRLIGDDVFDRIFHPSSVRLIEHCDAVLRIGGASAGADEMVAAAARKGKKIYRSFSEIPSLVE